MENKSHMTTAAAPREIYDSNPIKHQKPQAWQWETLAVAFLDDPAMDFFFQQRKTKRLLQDFFEAVIRDTFASGGAVFSSADRQAVLVWTRLAYTQEPPTEWKLRWHELLGDEGLRRYNALYEGGNLQLTDEQMSRSMLPDYLGVRPGSQCKGYGSNLSKWTFDYFYKLGFEIPFIASSTRRSAKLYSALLDFHIHKEFFGNKDDLTPTAVFLKSNKIR